MRDISWCTANFTLNSKFFNVAMTSIKWCPCQRCHNSHSCRSVKMCKAFTSYPLETIEIVTTLHWQLCHWKLCQCTPLCYFHFITQLFVYKLLIFQSGSDNDSVYCGAKSTGVSKYKIVTVYTVRVDIASLEVASP